jgi:molecular chaperone GrpE
MEDILRSAAVEDEQNDESQSTHPEPAPDATDALAAERDRLAQEKVELQDRLLRLQAEFDNFRKRSERERMEFAEYAGEQTAGSLLPIIDDFDRAINAASMNDAAGEFAKGLELIRARLLETLRKQGLEPIDTTGAKFDPHEHQAINRVQSDEHDDGDIVAEYQRGYKYKGRLLRPSMVQVSVKP